MFKEFLALALGLLFLSTPAFTQQAVQPPVKVKGQQATGYQIQKPNIQVPNKQATNLGGLDVLLETGNRNILDNPSFENATANSGWTLTSGTFVSDISPIDGKQNAQLTLSAQSFEFYQDSTTYASQFADRVQGLASVWVKTSITSTPIYVCSRQAGTTSAISSCVTVVADGKWGLYKVPFILGGTSNGVSVTSNAVAVTGDVKVDAGHVGANDIIQNVDQSRIAGESYFAANATCGWTRTSTTLGAFGTFAACPGPTVTYSSMGTWLTTDSDLPRQTINNLPAGVYKATFVLKQNTTADADVSLSIFDGTTSCAPMSGSNNSGTDGLIGQVVSCVFNYTSAGNRSFELYAQSSASSVNVTNATGTGYSHNTRFILEYYGSGSAYSSPCGLACADHFTAKVSSTGVVSDLNVPGWIGNASVASGAYTFTYGALGLTTAMNCQATSAGAAIAFLDMTIPTATNTTTGVAVTGASTTGSGASAGATPFTLTCDKTGADYIATRTIVGFFKGYSFNPSEILPKRCKVAFGGAGSLTSPTNCTGSPCTEYYDNCGTASTTRSGTGNTTTTFAAGTWKANSMVVCGITSKDTSTSLVDRNFVPPATDASGGLIFGSLSQAVSSTPSVAPTDAHKNLWCEAEAP